MTMTASMRRDLALASAVRQGFLGAGVDAEQNLLDGDEEFKPIGVFYDADMWHANLASLRSEFPSNGGGDAAASHFLHACAVKTNPLSWFMQQARDAGHGAECASVSEVTHALDLGFAPSSVIYDSPCKTVGEIKFALKKGVHLNVDNLQELERIQRLMDLEAQGQFQREAKGTIGIRINPLVGAGTIAQFSVSTGKSKFGVPLAKEGPERTKFLETVVSKPWITCVHVHTGSGGMGLDQLVAGVRVAVDFALEINKLAGKKQITVLDMGGGLAINWTAEDPLSAFPAYAAALRAAVPELFDPSVFDRVVTEFGAALHTKFAWIASRVEYTKSYDGGRIAMIHAGSDVLMRACYCPGTFVNHRPFAYRADGQPKTCEDSELVKTDIAGPLCFAGDVVLTEAKLPALEVDDIVALADVGGNSLSLKTTHCSRQALPVYTYAIDENNEVTFKQLRECQPVADTLKQWECRD
eukprot:TRINITY_DN36942_c0_g1_i1.p1 TRINITY_DN36942_c0_g1~~TRINITY_DN36942_c0_g1_i1.p1  ORF type:complete len:469 (-),score=107.37 TRINITY_DN36942_c0_g1_i1:150-1556(-)